MCLILLLVNSQCTKETLIATALKVGFPTVSLLSPFQMIFPLKARQSFGYCCVKRTKQGLSVDISSSLGLCMEAFELEQG